MGFTKAELEAIRLADAELEAAEKKLRAASWAVYYAANKEKIAARHAAYNAAHKEERKAYMRKYCRRKKREAASEGEKDDEEA